jgi:hypothetical protein
MYGRAYVYAVFPFSISGMTRPLLPHCGCLTLGHGSGINPPLTSSCTSWSFRNCSITDDMVPEPLRGKYLAFCPDRVAPPQSHPSQAGVAPGERRLSAGLAHLSALRAAGLNHLHLLPTYDFATVPERENEQQRVKVRGFACGWVAGRDGVVLVDIWMVFGWREGDDENRQVVA